MKTKRELTFEEKKIVQDIQYAPGEGITLPEGEALEVVIKAQDPKEVEWKAVGILPAPDGDKFMNCVVTIKNGEIIDAKLGMPLSRAGAFIDAKVAFMKITNPLDLGKTDAPKNP